MQRVNLVSILAQAKLIYILGFADDLNIIVNDNKHFVQNTSTLINEVKCIGFSVNDNKT